MNIRSKKGFTLVEIMIVVVIIGLLAAMAIPAFQKVRRSSLEKTVLNDGRQIGAAVQQYCMEFGVTETSTVSVTPATGILADNSAGTFTAYLKQIGKNYGTASVLGKMGADKTDAFKLQLNGAFDSKIAVFNGEGKMMKTE